MTRSTLILGSRTSRLAMWQAERVAALLRQAHPDLEVRIEGISTRGDRHQGPFEKGSDVGFFTRELERALHEGRIDLAVHSLKDLPTELPGGLALAAIPERSDPRDVLCARQETTLEELASGARVGTGSPRRRALLLHRRPDLQVVPIRGNVPTRINKMERGEVDAVILARAGLMRLEMRHARSHPLDPEVFVPAPGQAALGVEVRAEDTETLSLVAAIDDPASRAEVLAERAFLHRIEGGCRIPAGALARVDGDRLELWTMVASLDGERMIRGRRSGAMGDAGALGEGLAEQLLADGADEILARFREEDRA